MKRIFSGIQPTGGLMLGNYLGALKNWAQLQAQYDCMYCIVDLHAITIKQDPADLKQKTLEALATYLAAKVDPKKNILFVQSHVVEHAELAWILNCFAYMGELSRMTQFKDKSAKHKNIGVGLYTYPVLMAADILLYQTNLVPVGQDQKQHLELTRDIAIRMNNLYGPIFVVPEPYIAPVGAKIMSLQKPENKMSKSDEDPNATVFLSDSDDTIRKKFKKAVTDSGTEIKVAEDKPGVSNLIAIQSAITGKSSKEIEAAYVGKQYGHLKLETAEIVIQALAPMRADFEHFLKDRGELEKIIKAGSERARERAVETMKKVKTAVGFLMTLAIFSTAVLSGCSGLGAQPQATLGKSPSDGPVGRTIKANASKFVRCGKDSISIQTGTEQRMDLFFTLSPEGRVINPRVENIRGPDPDLRSCVTVALSSLTFPKPSDGKSKSIRYPLVLKNDD